MRGVGSGEWFVAVHTGSSVWSVEYHSPLPTPVCDKESLACRS
jgi:hypothetical protein